MELGIMLSIEIASDVLKKHYIPSIHCQKWLAQLTNTSANFPYGEFVDAKTRKQFASTGNNLKKGLEGVLGTEDLEEKNNIC